MRGNSSNPVNNAVGIQRQFSKQPQGEYVKRLQGLNLGTPQVGVDLKGETLARALGVLGGALNDEEKAHEKRVETRRTDEGIRIFNAASEEDKLKLSSRALLGQYSTDPRLVDDPYAQAVVEKLRGQTINKRLDQEFKAAVDRGEFKADTIYQHNELFDQFRQNKLEEMGITYDNKDAFERGFNEAYPINLASNADQFFKIKNTEKLTKAYNTLRVASDDLIESMGAMTPEGIKGSLQFYAHVAQGAQLPPQYLDAVYEYLRDSLAENGASPEVFEMLKNTEGYVNSDGTGKKIGDVIPMAAAKRTAGVKGLQMWSEEHAEVDRYLREATSKEDLRYRYNTLSPDMSKTFSSRHEAYAKAIEKAQLEREKQAQDMYIAQANKEALKTALTDMYEQYLNGETKYAGGTKLISSDKVTLYDAKTGGTKEVPFSQLEGELLEFTSSFEQGLLQRVADGELSVKEYTYKYGKLLELKPFAKAREAARMVAERSLEDLSYSASSKDGNGNFIMPPNVQHMLDVAMANKGMASFIYGSKAVGILSEIADHQRMAGNEQMGFNNWMQTTAFLKDPTAKENMKKRREALRKTTTSVSLPVLGKSKDTFGTTKDVTFSGEPYLEKVYDDVFDRYANMADDKTAHNKALAHLKDNYVAYGTTAIPKAFFGKTRDDEKTNVATLEYLREKHRETYGYNTVVIKYNYDNDNLTVNTIDGQANSIIVSSYDWVDTVQEMQEKARAKAEEARKKATPSYQAVQEGRADRKTIEATVVDEQNKERDW